MSDRNVCFRLAHVPENLATRRHTKRSQHEQPGNLPFFEVSHPVQTHPDLGKRLTRFWPWPRQCSRQLQNRRFSLTGQKLYRHGHEAAPHSNQKSRYPRR